MDFVYTLGETRRSQLSYRLAACVSKKVADSMTINC